MRTWRSKQQQPLLQGYVSEIDILLAGFHSNPQNTGEQYATEAKKHRVIEKKTYGQT